MWSSGLGPQLKDSPSGSQENGQHKTKCLLLYQVPSEANMTQAVLSMAGSIHQQQLEGSLAPV